MTTRIKPIVLISLMSVAVMPVAAHAVVVNKIVATIDGDPITLYEFEAFADRTTRTNPNANTPQLLDMLITDKLLQKEVADKGIVVRDEDVDNYIKGIKERNKIGDEQLEQALAAQFMTMDAYRKQVREEIQKAQLINREIRGKVNVTPEEVERYYQAHLNDYETPEKMHLRHILLKLPADASGAEVSAATAKADDVYRRLKGGADFAEMAKEVSEDPAAKDGGDLGWVKPGEVLDAIDKATKDLKPGQFSKPFRSDIGIHIIKLEERTGASHKPLDELAGGIKEQLYNAALEERYEKWLTEELRKRHNVEVRQ
ncbi:MAG TPA: peptidylprolyl isomerase [Candidatus Binatia bacterium]|nr:peptidylprolyl isomerase [Candidatus Binatia bacterium]